MGRRGAPQGSFADLEFAAQGVALDATLHAIAEFLDDQGDLVALVYQDLVRGLKQPQRGRDGLTADQVLRAFVLQRVKNWGNRSGSNGLARG